MSNLFLNVGKIYDSVASQTDNANLVWKKDGNGIPGWRIDSNTTYSNATTSTAGLMSASDKSILTWRTGNGTRHSNVQNTTDFWCTWASYGKICMVNSSGKIAANHAAWSDPFIVATGLPSSAYSTPSPLKVDNQVLQSWVSVEGTNLKIIPRGSAVNQNTVYKIDFIYFI